MNGHPAIAYLVAQHLLDERRREARRHHLARTFSRKRSPKPGSRQLTITKDVS